MVDGGKILHNILETLVNNVRPNQTGAYLDNLAYKMIIDAKGSPAFKGFNGYPSTICVSLNDSIVHGIPNETPFKEGDIVSLDIGLRYNGFCTDTATSVIVDNKGRITIKDINSKPFKSLTAKEKLLFVTSKSLELAITSISPGDRIGKIGSIIQQYAEPYGFSVIRDLVGHGIGAEVHQSPNIPNYGTPTKGEVINVGDTLAIEPMISNGSFHIKTMSDGWEIKTEDGSIAAHFEHTIYISTNGAVILT